MTGAGSIRQKQTPEADLLTWEQIDIEHGQVQVRRTAHFEPKTEESQRGVDVPPDAQSH